MPQKLSNYGCNTLINTHHNLDNLDNARKRFTQCCVNTLFMNAKAFSQHFEASTKTQQRDYPCVSRSFVSFGRKIEKVDPLPTSLATWMRPPWPSTMAFTVARPMP
jgi:hypothetical protein